MHRNARNALIRFSSANPATSWASRDVEEALTLAWNGAKSQPSWDALVLSGTLLGIRFAVSGLSFSKELLIELA